ncbi:LPD7 domain-containing protein [Burkholderia sp. Leaf177]|uniref:LPD7 domain-containing protein n=1 Tax=Burkholderia sp. Leaf177 TaxID=1736287 RepID=UPI001F1A2C46|nr:LPD7 domain-containing protein [Burkholderia sp. Leaf177]
MKKYLEDGRKLGRELERDEMDERVILVGDLELTNSIIQSINVASNVDRYLSVTLSFKEDEVSRETLLAITEEFRAFVSAAYRPDEINFYAEAHLPKVKSYLDDASGKLVERKPHIHVVIPKTNLISGGHLEPLGFVKSNIDFIDAFQEHINAKYGLASPKDNRRIEFSDASEMISRYKGDLFKGSSRDLKETLLGSMLDRKIEQYDDFMALLAEHGQTRLRNQGRENEYPNVKVADALKGVNLKDHVFSRAFVELPTAEKLMQLSADIQPKYESSGTSRETAPAILKTLAQWHMTRALEVKYLNNGNTKSFPAYQAASVNERMAMLEQRRDAFYSKHLEDLHESGSERPSSGRSGGTPSSASGGSTRVSPRRVNEHGAGDRRFRGDGRLHEFDRGPKIRSRVDPLLDGGSDAQYPRGPGSGSPAGLPPDARRDVRSGPRGATERQQHGAFPDSQGTPTPALNGMRGMSGVPVDRFTLRRAVLVPHHALHQLEHERAVSPDSVRRNSHRERAGVRKTGRRADSVLSQRMRDERERIVQRSAGDEYSVIRSNLDPRRLLAELSHSHGVRPEKYGITQGRDGASRIRAGARHLNVSDFLTKELHLPWRDASDILRGSYQRQISGAAIPMTHELPRAALWREYTTDRDVFRRARQDAMATQQTSEQSRRAQIKQTFNIARDAARNNLDLRPSGRRALVSIARMTKADAEQTLRGQIQLERDALIAKYGPRQGASFGEFLQARAQAGDTRALVELRRIRPTTPEPPQPEENWIMPVGEEHARGKRQAPTAEDKATASESGYDNQIIYRVPHLSYEVHRDGVVTYQHDGRSVVRDHGSAVRVLKTDPAAIEAALRLSQAKFGPVLKLQGPVEMQREAARVAAEAGLYVEFSDNLLNDIMYARRVELIADRATVLETRSKDRSRRRDAPAKPTPAGKDHAPDPVLGVNSPPDEDLRLSSRSGHTL